MQTNNKQNDFKQYFNDVDQTKSIARARKRETDRVRARDFI